MIHVPIRPTAGSAQLKSPSQVLASVAEPDLAQELVQRARRVVDPRERLRDDHGGDRLRHEQDGAEEEEAAHLEAREERRQEEPDHDREDRVEEDQLDRVLEGAVDLGRVPELAVVVEADPLLRREAVPFVERQPDGLQQREEREEPDTPPGRAGCRGRRRCAARPAPVPPCGARPPRARGSPGRAWRSTVPLARERPHSLERLVERRPFVLDRLGRVCAGVWRWAIIFWNSVPITVSMLVDAQSG